MDYNINFPHLGIYLDYVIKSIDINGFSIAMYGIVIAGGMVLGTLLARAEARRTGQNPDDYLTFAIMSILIAVACARIYYVIFSLDLYRGRPLAVFNLREGGLAIYGGVLGAIFASWLFSRIKKIRLGLLMDTAVPGLVLGQIIGRWGNFFNREAFGGYTDSLLAMQLPLTAVRAGDVNDALMSHVTVVNGISYIQVHPTFLYESLWNLGVLIILLIIRKKKKFDGEIFSLYLVGYGIGRAWIEGLRTDQLLIPGTQTAVSQVLSIVLAAFGFVLILVGRRRALAKQKE